MNRTVWAIAALFYVAGVLTVVVAEQSINLLRMKPASAEVSVPNIR
ncbi:hypothetical protein [Bradyrhizobium sp. BR 1433]